MKLSIVVPVHNMAADQKLTFCLDSLIGQQNINDYEIICVDDASTDDSPRILQEYAAKYPEKIKVILQKENLRQGGARNTGMKAATGEWLGFMDSDDWADPFMFASLLEKAEETGADVVGCDYQLVSKHSFEPGKYVQNSFDDQTGVMGLKERKQLTLRAGSMVVKIYRKSVIDEKKLCFPEKMFYEDNAEAPVWMMSFTHFERVAKPLYFYYQHEGSTVHVINQDKLLDRIKAGEILIQETKERDLFLDCREELIHKYIQLAFCNTLFSYAQSCNESRFAADHKKKSGKMELGFLKKIHERIVTTLACLQREEDLRLEYAKEEEERDYARIKKLTKELSKNNASIEKDVYYAYTCMISNPYYQDGFDKEQKKFLEMFLLSPGKMKRHYELLMWYRKLRYGKKS